MRHLKIPLLPRLPLPLLLAAAAVVVVVYHHHRAAPRSPPPLLLVSAFTPIGPGLASRRQQRTGMGVFGNDENNPMDAGSGIFYDADPSRMERAAAAASAAASSLAGGKMSTSSEATNSSARLRRPRSAGGDTSGIPKDVLIIGAGLAGLSTAFHLATTTTRSITILERESPGQQMTKTTAGSFAAAGMLAPQSERLPTGPLLDLCLKSREMYPAFVASVEEWARRSGKEGERYLWKDCEDGGEKGNNEGGNDNDKMEPWEVGFTSSGGFLAPAFAGDGVATWAPPSASGTARWLDAVQVRELEPQLHRDVVGGWWFPEDASVDARRLTCSLRAACVGAGVHFMTGEGCEAKGLELSGGKCRGVRLADGRTLAPRSVLVANGSWMRDLLPVPIVPHKGQSFSVRMPPNSPPLLSRVLFAQDTYIVPKADGRIVIGATVEAGTFDPSVTPAGMMHCMANALQLVPGLADLPMEESWAGLRPTTPDKGPILGETPWTNLFLAGGYWRNGVLLAPKTGQLLGDLIAGNSSDEDDDDDEHGSNSDDDDRRLLAAFAWDRFTAPGGGDKLAADARYAASMHPVHRRSSGSGISAAVGTELGFYSGAGAAAEERARDRASLFGDVDMTDDDVDSFERAAMMGKTDASAFSFGDGFGDENAAATADAGEVKMEVETAEAGPMTTPEEESVGELAPQDLYAQFRSRIDAVKAEAAEHGDLVPAERIPNVEERRLEGEREHMDAFTHPGLLEEAAAEEERRKVYPADVLRPPVPEGTTPEESAPPGDDDYDETTYDGYQAILKDDWGASEADLKEKMRRARIQNRGKVSEIDESKIGAARAADDDGLDDLPPVAESESATTREEGAPPPPSSSPATSPAATDLSSVYEKIKSNKSAAAASRGGVEMDRAAPDERPDPGFRIYRVDPESRESREVPPYTTFQAMEEMIAAEKKTEEGQPDATAASSSSSHHASPASTMNDESSFLGSPAACNAIDVPGPTEAANDDEYNEETYDGYQAILKDDWGASETELKEKMRRARIQNRGKVSEIDESAIGAVREPDDLDDLKKASTADVAEVKEVKEITTETPLKLEQPDLSSIYEKIISNKAAASEGVEMEQTATDERPDPGFRIFRVDPETRESFEIPPYTQPGAVEEMIAEAKKQLDGGPSVSNYTSSAEPVA